MMKKISIIIIVIALIVCSVVFVMLKKPSAYLEPNITEIRSICNLATLQCYYNNVAQSVKEGNFLQKDREFWIEYTGIAKIGVDMSKVSMKIKGKDITVILPEAELLEIDIKELSKDSYIMESDGFIKNKITVEDQSKAISDAQEKMKENVENNKTLLTNAQTRAKNLIENYIKIMGEISNIDYKIKWIYETNETNVE